MSRRKKPGEIFVDGIQPTEKSDSEKSDSEQKQKQAPSPTRSDSMRRNWQMRRKRAAAEKETEMKKTSDSPAEETSSKETVTGEETVVREEEETVSSYRGVPPEEMARRLPSGVYHNNQMQMGPETATSDHPTTMLIRKNLEVAMLPTIDMMDAAAVRTRILEYFEIEARYQNKPTVSGLAMALNGMSRFDLWAIRTGNTANYGQSAQKLPPAVVHEIKIAHALMEQLWEDNMQNGRINPVVGIFLGKNNFGYMDRTDYVITPNAGDSEYSQQEIRERLGLPASDSDE